VRERKEGILGKNKKQKPEKRSLFQIPMKRQCPTLGNK